MQLIGMAIDWYDNIVDYQNIKYNLGTVLGKGVGGGWLTQSLKDFADEKSQYFTALHLLKVLLLKISLPMIL